MKGEFMNDVLQFNIYTDFRVLREEVEAPCEHDGSEIVIVEFQGEEGADCVAMTLDAASCLSCGLTHVLNEEPIEERPAWQRYIRGLFYLAGLVSFVYLIVYLTQRLI